MVFLGLGANKVRGAILKIAIIGDTHFGYPRFFEDSFAQGEAAFLDADKKADLILFLGDLFDARIPNLTVLGRAVSLLRKIKAPVYAIHGNHERRSRGALNPVELLGKAGLLHPLHASAAEFEKGGGKVFIAGMGNVPDDLGKKALGKFMEGVKVPGGAFSVLMLHQSFSEFVYGEDLLSVSDVEELPFSLIVNGHVHARKEALGGRFLVPGGTVITQLTKEEMGPRGYILYDTGEKKHEFVQIPCREFIFEEMEFSDASLEEVEGKVKGRLQELREGKSEAIVRVRVKGTLAKGLRPSNVQLPSGHLSFIDNRLNERLLRKEIGKIRELREKKLGVRELTEKRLREKLGERITLFDPFEFFEKLQEGPDAAMEYLNRKTEE